MANEKDLYSFLSMCELFDEVKEKCVLASKEMIRLCEENQDKDASQTITRLAEKRGQMIKFLEGLQIKVLETSKSTWETTREEMISSQRIEHFNRGVIRWSLEMENLESLLQSNLERLKKDTRVELSTAFKNSKLHKGYDLNDIR